MRGVLGRCSRTSYMLDFGIQLQKVLPSCSLTKGEQVQFKSKQRQLGDSWPFVDMVVDRNTIYNPCPLVVFWISECHDMLPRT